MRKIELPPRGLETLFGVHDQNIKYLESLLDVRVDVRGQDMKIDGAPKDVATVEAILSDFAALLQEGHQFTDKELREAFAQIAEDRAYRLRDYFTNARFNPSGKKLVAPKTANQRRYLEAISQNDMVFGIGPAGTGKCIKHNSLVLTTEGLVTIATLCAGVPDQSAQATDFTVHGLNGPEKVSHTYNGGFSETIKVTTRLGYSIEATPEHPLLVFTADGTTQWRRTDELQLGDTLVLQRGQKAFGHKTAIDFTYQPNGASDRSSKPINISQLDEELAYVMGLLTGDGCLTVRNQIRLASADVSLIEIFRNLVTRLGLHSFPNNQGLLLQEVVSSSQFYQLLLQLGMSNAKAAGKEVPHAILTAPEKVVAAYLRGLFDTDGTIEKRDGLISLNSISERLISQVQTILLNFGIVAAKAEKRTRYKNAPHLSYLLTIAGAEAERFHTAIGFGLERKRLPRQTGILCGLSGNFAPFACTWPSQMRSTSEQWVHAEGAKVTQRTQQAASGGNVRLLEHQVNNEALARLQELLEKRWLLLEVTALTPSQAQVYDLTVPGTHSFIANGFVNHNTYLAVAKAVHALTQKKVNRIILTRPAVEAGEKLGYLPGDLQEKIDPYLRPLYDALFDVMDHEKVTKFMEKRVIEIAPLAFMRGRTLADAFIILDEAQNTTSEQMKMFLTRIGFGSQAVITGDVTQIDLPRGQRSGLVEAARILQGIEGIGFVHFTEKDVVRHRLVQMIIKAYESHNAGSNF